MQKHSCQQHTYVNRSDPAIDGLSKVLQVDICDSMTLGLPGRALDSDVMQAPGHTGLKVSQRDSSHMEGMERQVIEPDCSKPPKTIVIADLF